MEKKWKRHDLLKRKLISLNMFYTLIQNHGIIFTQYVYTTDRINKNTYFENCLINY